MQFKQVFGAYFWNQLNKTFEFGLGFFTSIIVARQLGPSEYGVYSAVISFALLFLLFASFGFEQVVNAQIPKLLVEEKKGEAVYLFKRLIVLRFILLCFACTLLQLFSTLIGRIMHIESMSPYLKLIAFFIILSGISSLLSFMLIAQLKMRAIAEVGIISKALKLFLSWLLLRMGFGIPGLILLAIGLSFLEIIFYSYYLRPIYFTVPRKVDLTSYGWMGANFWLIGIVNYLLERQVDIIFLGIFSVPVSQIAYYSLAATLTLTIGVITVSGLGGVGLTAFSSIHADRGEKALAQAWGVLVKFTILLTTPLLCFTIFFADKIILYVYTEKYLPAANLLRWLCLYQVGTKLVGGDSSLTALYASGREKAGLIIRSGCGILNVVLDIVLIKFIGVFGAVIATGTSFFLANLAEYLTLRKVLSVRLPYQLAAKGFAASVLAGLICIYIPAKNLAGLVGIGIAFVFSFVVIISILKPLKEQDRVYVNKLPAPFAFVMARLVG